MLLVRSLSINLKRHVLGRVVLCGPRLSTCESDVADVAAFCLERGLNAELIGVRGDVVGGAVFVFDGVCKMYGDDDKLWVRQPHKVVQRVAPVVGPLLKAEGFILVNLRYNPAGSPLLQVFVDRPSEGPFADPASPQEPGQGINIDELADLSRLLSDTLDVEDPLSGAYRLEVSSPGLQRDLCWRSDFIRATGLTVNLRCSVAVEGRKTFKGILLAAEAEALHIQLEDQQEYVVPVDTINRAQLDFGPLASGRAATGAGRGK